MKIYINNVYCPDAVAEDLFGDLITENDLFYEHSITKCLCWNGIVYELILMNPYTRKLYFKIVDE